MRCKERAHLVFLDLMLTVLPPSSVFWTPFRVFVADTAALALCTCSYAEDQSSFMIVKAWEDCHGSPVTQPSLPEEPHPAQPHERRHASELLTSSAIDMTEISCSRC